MRHLQNHILVINGGSSSIKFASYESDGSLNQLLRGEVERIGSENATFRFVDNLSGQTKSLNIEAATNQEAAHFLIGWMESQKDFDRIGAIGHRIVHGMQHSAPEPVSTVLLDELKKISAFDPDHLPAAINLVEIFQQRFPVLQQIACFDTAFHTTMPMVAKLLPIPRKYYSVGIQRYGFHGLSYTYLMEELGKLSVGKSGNEKIILAHLGNGASLAAVKDGKSIDTSMGFTPTSGVPMSTRCGDLDPGVAWYLMREKKLDAKAFNHLVNHQSGLLGISETNSDMRELMKIEAADIRAAEAIELFCYQTKKWIGAFAAALGGLDTLVFSGGIGENAPEVRVRICNGLQFLGIELDEKRNANNEEVVSAPNSKVIVRVIKTNEELIIAKLVCDVLASSIKH